MIFDSPAFVFFIAFGLFFYSLSPAGARKYFLLALCAIWYGSWHPIWPLLLLGAAAINYGVLRGCTRAWIYPCVIAGDTAFLVFLRLIPSLAARFHGGWEGVIGSETPFGASFFCFLMIAYVFDRGRGTIREGEGGLEDFLLYVSFFPMLVAGPIERYQRLSAQLRSLEPVVLQNLADGAMIFSYGFIKKAFIGAPLRDAVGVLLSPPAGLANLVVGGLLATFQAYVEFSGYCDMGRGIARCFGVRLEPNFRPFYYSRNPNEFWQRWNITLGTWIRDYVTLPLMLRFGRRVNRYLIILFAFLILGFWHGIESHWILFGLFDGALIVLFFAAQNGLLRRSPRLLCLWGFALAFCVYVGNGILQNGNFMKLAQSVFLHPAAGNLWGDLRGICFGSTGLVPWLAVLFAADYLQERSGNADFFLEVPRFGRLAAAAALTGWFLVSLHGGSFIDVPERPPLYFRL